ncbi:MAG: AraC family transcriptional regulator [Bacteroidales bacterium]|nr:AraC family transcriptional regulator [Bacteroidales bacterium]
MSVFNKIPWALSSSMPGKDYVRSVGDSVILVRRPHVQTLVNQPFKTEDHVFLLCTGGWIDGKVNMVPRHLDGYGFILMRPGQVVQFTSVSDDFQMLLVIVSSEFLSRMGMNLTEFMPFNFLIKMLDSPIIKLRKEDTKDAIALFNLMFRLAKNEDNPYREKSILNVIKAFCYEAGYYIMKNNPEVVAPQQNSVVERLLPLIRQHFRKHRETSFYASKLSLSPNYLYKVVMSVSGKSVRGWIEDYVVMEAKAMLRSSSMSVQQIAENLNFPSQTFFGKYFKRVTGVSPKQYREQINAL